MTLWNSNKLYNQLFSTNKNYLICKISHMQKKIKVKVVKFFKNQDIDNCLLVD